MSNNDCFDLTEPENALALKIKEKVLDRVTNCSTKEQVREELLNIINEYQDRLPVF